MYSRTGEGWEPMKPSRNGLSKPSAKKTRTQSKKPKNNNLSQVQIAPVSIGQKQSFGSNSRKSWRFKNSELIATVSGSVSFAANAYDVNPGIAATFPWLSVEAVQWEQYRFHRLRFRYVTRSSTATAGSVILSPDYASKDLAPTTETQAVNTADAVEDSVWKEIHCELDPNSMFPTGPRKFIRSAAIGGDINLYDALRFYLCTVAESDTSAIGKLFVDYDVELFIPQNSPADSSGPSTMSMYLRASSQSFTNNTPAAIQWDAATYDPLRVGAPVSGVVTPPKGVYQVSWQASFLDNTNESFQVNTYLYKNGSAVTGASTQSLAINSTGSGVNHSGQFIVTANGTDTFSVYANCQGSAGTLTCVANTGAFLWKAV